MLLVSGGAGRRSDGLAAILTVLALVLLLSGSARAWAPFVHGYTGTEARTDALDDGRVTINGQSYAVDPKIVDALRKWPAHYNAGCVGPDGFPDLVMGQTVIHPGSNNPGEPDTGEWLRWILKEAWNAQKEGSGYTEDEKGQILAFAYGYLTHAGGDEWAHTLVNDFALGVWPAIAEALTNVDKASIIIRHLAVEGYMKDAVPGWDGNPERGPVCPAGSSSEGTNCNDISDNSSPAMPLEIPNKFVQNMLDSQDTPTLERGLLYKSFVTLRNELAAQVSNDPDPLADALNAYNDTKNSLDSVCEACNFDSLGDLIDCPLALAELGWTFTGDSLEAFAEFSAGILAASADVVYDAYLNAWVEDIDEGLAHWNELSLAVARGVFDVQVRRDLQNYHCKWSGAENTQLRIDCEDGIGLIDTVLDQADPYINQHLLSMLGAPDALGGLREALQNFSDELDELLGPASMMFNPIKNTEAELKEKAKKMVEGLIEESTGLNVELAKEFLSTPGDWLNVQSMSTVLPGLGSSNLQLFRPEDHARLDGYMQLPPNHLVDEGSFLPGTNVTRSRLSDDATVNPYTFAPLYNTVMNAKLLLLDGPELNKMLQDSLVSQGIIKDGSKIIAYPEATDDVPANIMVQAMNPSENWLRSLDSDHAWRADGLPRFCDTGGALPADSQRPPIMNGGNGNFPIWESCLLRPIFRVLYKDWENSSENFPALGDHPSSDPSDPDPPVSSLAFSGARYTSDGKTFVAADNSFVLSATDLVFVDGQIGCQQRVYKDGVTPAIEDWAFLANGGYFSIPAASGDGLYHIDFRAEDPCHTFDVESKGGGDALPPEPTHTESYILDTTPPVIAISTPAADAVFDTDDLIYITYSVDDGSLGSGVATAPVKLDGTAATNGQKVDMFYLWPGLHSVFVGAEDNVGNSCDLTHTFRVSATCESICNNIEKAWSLHLITDAKVYKGLRDKAVAAQNAHKRGLHSTEWNVLGGLINQLSAQRGQGIEMSTTDRFIAFANDVISSGG